MPPKAAAKHQKDWSWADTVSSADAITLAHRRAAAGLGPNTQKACAIVKRKEARKSKSPDKGNGLLRALSERNGNGKRAISVDSTGTDASVVFVKEMSCTTKRCAGNPRCYNHLGMDKVGLLMAWADSSGGRKGRGRAMRATSSARRFASATGRRG